MLAGNEFSCHIREFFWFKYSAKLLWIAAFVSLTQICNFNFMFLTFSLYLYEWWKCIQDFHRKCFFTWVSFHEYSRFKQDSSKGGKREESPVVFQRSEKRCSDFRKHSLIFVIYGLNFSFKMQKCSFHEKKPQIFPCWAFLSRFVHDCLSQCSNSKKTTLP